MNKDIHLTYWVLHGVFFYRVGGESFNGAVVTGSTPLRETTSAAILAKLIEVWQPTSLENLDSPPKKKYRVKVYRDQDPCDPRADYDHVGTMVCWHGRYKLGDEQPSEDGNEHRLSLIPNNEKLAEKIDALWSYENPMPYKEAREAVTELVGKAWDKLYISLPLYLMDHGGISISTGAFGCPWDSGQVGFIYVSEEKARETLGWGKITASRLAQVLEVLRAEVEEYDAYLQGEVYGFDLQECVPAPPCPTCGHAKEDDWQDAGDGCGGILNINGVGLAEAILDNISLDTGITLSDVEQAIEDAIC